MNNTSSVFLETAAAIGARLCRDAFWDSQRCNWLGDSMEFESNAWKVVHRAFGPELYNGTSGIALFLARLFRLSKEKPYRTAAVGAALHALSCANDLSPAARVGLYSGQTGIAYTLIELAEIFGIEELLSSAFALVEGLASLDSDSQPLDVISGSAGAIPALLDLHRRYSRDLLLDLAVRHGEHLLRTATKSEAGLSWNTLSVKDQPDLLGFSHGTAGIGWALMELSQATNENKFREAAHEAFRYERGHFSAEHDNWPDLRNLQSIQGGQNAGPSYAVAWCHGAPGIGLSRLRAYEFSRDAVFRSEAEAALRTTMKALDPALYGGQANYSLCHGLSGNAELLLYAAQVLERPDYRTSAEQLGLKGIESYEKNRMPWPCGVPGGGETPNLMLGLAGIGHFYLRLHDPAGMPSILILLPRAEVKSQAA